jgi:hypothetical protein
MSNRLPERRDIQDNKMALSFINNSDEALQVEGEAVMEMCR